MSAGLSDCDVRGPRLHYEALASNFRVQKYACWPMLGSSRWAALTFRRAAAVLVRLLGQVGVGHLLAPGAGAVGADPEYGRLNGILWKPKVTSKLL